MWCCAPAGALPEPISAAEKAAAEAAAGYLARGPIAFYERLTADAPLRSIDREAALQEIEVRAGEPARAHWTMRTARPETAAFEVSFPSGADELVMLEMKEVAGIWKIASIHTLAETVTRPPKPGDARPAPVPATREQMRFRVVTLAIAALLLAITGAATRHTMRISSTVLLFFAAIAFCAQVALIINPTLTLSSPQKRMQTASAPKVPFAQLRRLLRFRRAMTRGETLPPAGAVDDEVAETARLWRMQVSPVRSSEVSSSILSETPLVSLLRARGAADEGRTDDATKQYELFRQRVNSPDAFWFEQMTGQVAKAKNGADVSFTTSRDAGAYYMETMFDVLSGAGVQARERFRQAWRMQPMTRPDVVRAGFFAPLLRDPMISVLINLNQPEEPRSADVELGRSPMQLPPRARVSASGAFVRIAVGSQQLDIPGGTDIAPPDTEVVAATEWDRREEANALEDFDQLVRSRLATPGSRLRAEKTASVLADHNRWTDVVTLTESVGAESENVPLGLLVDRVRALVRLHRVDDARALAKSTAVGNAVRRGGGVGMLVELAELLTQAGAYDDAIEMYKRVESSKRGPDVAPRIRQADLRRSLASTAAAVTTEHFEIHAAPDVAGPVAERVGQLLEKELVRVTSRVPLTQFPRVRVNILNWEDFSSQLTGSDDVLGLYDGDITIPFGTVDRFKQQAVAILTHEMTHAVVAQASDGNAPRWFQEGLARRMELVERQENIFQNRTTQQIPSISVLDAQLEAATDAQSVSDAYRESATFMRFLEDRYGPQSINDLVASYRTGANTDEAFVNVTRKNTVDIDREFRDWGATHAEAFLDKTPWPYGQFYSLGIDKKVLEGFRWSKKPAVKH